MAGYANGKLYVLIIPENFSDIYNLPVEVLSGIKRILTKNIYVTLEAPGKVSLFVYDNHLFITESFLDETINAGVLAGGNFSRITDVVTGETFPAENITTGMPGLRSSGGKDVKFTFPLKPHSYRVFKME